jgi:hypothetical protein
MRFFRPLGVRGYEKIIANESCFAHKEMPLIDFLHFTPNPLKRE